MTSKLNLVKEVPSFTPGDNYQLWKKLVLLWKATSDVATEKQGPLLIFNLSGKAQEIAVNEADKSIDNIVKKLDEVYLETNNVFNLYTEFENYKRSEGQSMKEYITVFEQKIDELKTEKLELPELVTSFKMLKGANLCESDKQLVYMSCSKELKVQEMKDALLMMSNKLISSSDQNTNENTIKVKEEVVDHNDITFYAERQKYGRNPKYFSNGQNNSMMNGSKQQSRFNPTRDRQCFGCGEYSHWIKDCHNPWKLRDSGYYPQTNNRQPKFKNESPKQMHSRKTFHATHSNCCCDENYFASENFDECQPLDTCYDYNNTDHQTFEPEKKIFYQSNVGNEEEDILLVEETLNMVVLDCGASKTVCGQDWYSNYVDSLDRTRQKEITEFPSTTTFKFGMGSQKALKKVHLPVSICDKDIFLEIHVVETDIPCLLSLKTMKSLGMHIDFENDTLELGNKKYDLHTTSTGHYCLPLLSENDCSSHIINVVSNSSIQSQPKKKALKLHRRFAHAKSKKIIQLLKTADIKDLELESELTKLDEECEFCLRYRRVHPRPRVSLPLATQFNELVAMDLKDIEDVKVLHCIDYVTRFSSAFPVSSKDPDECIDAFFKIWIVIFGPPQRILSDNGGEFINHKFKSLCHAFNIKHDATAAESPFSNGIVERHNALLGQMTLKVRHDTKCSIPIALMWAVHAKNTLINIFGFSPYQLVFGRNPSIPGNSTNKLPALTSETSSATVANHLNALKHSREAYMQAENSNRIQRALRGKVFEGTHQRFIVGDSVYYKRNNSKSWEGPGKVLAQDGAQVLIKSGARSLIKVHPCKLVLKKDADETLGNENFHPQTIPSTKDQCIIKKPSKNQSEDYSEDEESLTSPGEANPSEPSSSQETIQEELLETPTNKQIDFPKDVEDKSCDEAVETAHKTDNHTKIKESKAILKKGDKIYFKGCDSEDFVTGTILSRGGKSTGQYKNCWNLSLHDGKQINLNLDQVDWIKGNTDPESILFANQITQEIFVESVKSSDAEKYLEEKKQELEKWKKFHVYDEVSLDDFPNSEVLSARWVITEKQVNDSLEYKARLVIRGFQESDAPVSDSPTAGKTVLRLCLVVGSSKSWKIESLDVYAAFLQSEKLNRTILMKPPKEFKKDSNTIWKINKPVYGLNDASRKWFLTVKKKLLSLGCKPLKHDCSVYIYQHESNFSGFLVIHVDDFIIAGNEHFHDNVISKLTQSFEISKRNQSPFKYIGWNINQDSDGVIIDQVDYQNSIQPMIITKERSNQTNYELGENERKEYQQLLGKLQWISSQSRPDVRFSVLECSIAANKPLVSDALKINRVVKKLQKVSLYLFLPSLSLDLTQWKIIGFADAALCNLPDKVSSTNGHIIFLTDGSRAAPMSWSSRKIKRVTRTIISAECIALGLCLDECILIKEMILDILSPSNRENSFPIIAVTDSKSLYDNIYSTNQAEDLRLRREVASIRQLIQNKEISKVIWKPTELQLADPLTKSTASPQALLHVLHQGSLLIDLNN